MHIDEQLIKVWSLTAIILTEGAVQLGVTMPVSNTTFCEGCSVFNILCKQNRMYVYAYNNVHNYASTNYMGSAWVVVEYICVVTYNNNINFIVAM